MALGRDLKRKVVSVLESETWQQDFAELMELHTMQNLIAPLFSALCAKKELTRWHAITCFGKVMNRMMKIDSAKARIVMRRIMWMLNEESGGCGWGVPEAMGEITASHKILGDEYGRILLSYIHEEESGPENYLEFPLLLRGAIWGVARLAQDRPDIANPATNDLIKFLNGTDPLAAGLACWGLAGLKSVKATDTIKTLIDNQSQITVYMNCKMQTLTVSQLAKDSLERINA